MLSLSVVIPTYNEKENISVLMDRLLSNLSSIKGAYEIIVVDDSSPDFTSGVVEQYARIHHDIRLIRRVDKRDLSAALALGFDSAKGEYLLAMDADLQHSPGLAIDMLEAAQRSNADLVVATRYAMGGSTSNWGALRGFLSRFSTRLAAYVVGTTISDPLSGFFILRRDVWGACRPRMHLAGFKILLEIISANPGISSHEIGYQFVARERGKSKLGFAASWAFILALLRLFWKVRMGVKGL